MKLEHYKTYFPKAKIGDRVHYIHRDYHFVWVLRHKLPDGFLGKSFLTGQQKFTDSEACSEMANNYIQPKENRWQYRFLQAIKKRG